MAGRRPIASRTGAVIAGGTAVVVIGTIATAAVLVPGYDVHDVPKVSTTVWVTRDNGQYARVNTDLHEFDAVNAVADPSAVVQRGGNGIVFTQGYVQSWTLNPAAPVDLVASDSGAADAKAGGAPSPAGTDAVSSYEQYVLYQTTTGDVYLGSIPTTGQQAVAPAQLDPFANVEIAPDEEPPVYVADAAAVGPHSRVVMYSAAEGGVREYDANKSSFTGDVRSVPNAPAAGTDLSMVIVGKKWVMYSPADSRVWIEGLDSPVDTSMGADALLQAASSDGDGVLLADAEGIEEIAVSDGSVTKRAEASGTPAAPIVVDGIAYGAWLDTASGRIWSSDTGDVRDIEIEQGSLDDVLSIEPVLNDNGDRAVLTERATGMVWTLPDGQLITTDAWDALDGSETLEGAVQVDDVVQQEPPTAADDEFGVRRGAVVMLPVLLNDSDPNKKDVLTIDEGSLSGPADQAFGQVGLAENDQYLVFTVSASSGSTTLTYAASDGQAVSEKATVTLNVIPDDQNSAPEWCPMEDCTQQPLTPQIAPGGFVKIPALANWVDAEGDAIALADARPQDPSAPVTVVPTAGGDVVIRHVDPNGGEATIPIVVSVMDSRGATTEQTIDLRVTASPSLKVEPAALTVAPGHVMSMDIADWVSGGSGSYRLVDASAVAGAGLTVSPSPATGSVDLLASSPGTFQATYTVEDTLTLAQQSAVIRVTAPDANRIMTAPPLTAFVRPGEDTTVDVLSAVSSASGRVLMVRSATTTDPDLSVSTVDQSYVRVSATTTAVPLGPIGVADIVIADGTGAVVKTKLAVFLLQPSHGIGPVAAPDTVSVRAGEQIDIPVLDNDSSPRGERLKLSNSVEGSGAQGELAFGNGSVVRYLAPSVPGTYTLTYSTYLESDAARTDSSTVTVTVLAQGSNRAPQPPQLVARAVAGQSVTIDVPTGAMDPDGDPVIVTDVSQPGAGLGVASVGGTGTTITYRAPAGGVEGGEVSFDYSVRDAAGEVASGTVRVGVLDKETDAAPVTYSDRVAVTLGSPEPITINPLLNDRDPGHGKLKLTSLVPNAIDGSDEWARLEELIDTATSLEDGTVVLHAGDVEGTVSFVYTVQSQTTFSTATGLIVLAVSDKPAPDGMVIQDTVLTAQNRRDIATGVDVLSGKVQWATGNTEDLKLELWGDAAAKYRVNGRSIIGSLPEQGDLVPFAVTGLDANGEAVTSYGFLRIPAFQDLRLQLRSDIDPVKVDEEKTVEFGLRDMLRISPADSLEIRRDESFTVQRANAVCSPTSGDKASYAAGREAPFLDTCSVAVRLKGQQTWSIVAVPVVVVPKDPLASLSPVSLTVIPGDTTSVDMLGQMISWEGGRVGDEDSLALTASYQGSSFVVTQTGNEVSVQAYANAKPGTVETIIVQSPAFGGLRSAITVKVGPALPDTPRGGTFSQTCYVSRGGSCPITVVGIANEYDPYAGKPGSGLTLQSVGTGSSVVCDVATVTKLSDSQVVATWPTGIKPLGGECVVDFTVADAQGKTGTGRLTIDVQGYPPAPQSIDTTSYTATSVTMQVRLADAALTHPAVTSVTLWEGGAKVAGASCAPGAPGSYTCTVGGLVNGEQHTYTARAVNTEGESPDSSAETTWAYSAPTVTSVDAVTVYDSTLTTATQGVVSLTVASPDDVASFKIYRDANLVTTMPRTGAVTTSNVVMDVGVANVRVVPVSRFTPPIAGDNTGTAGLKTVTVAGKPLFSHAPAATNTSTSTTIQFTPQSVEANYSDMALSTVYVVWVNDPAPSCTMVADAASVGSRPDVVTSTSPTISGLTANQDYHYGLCGSNGFGAAWTQGSNTLFTWVPPSAPTGSNLTYTVSTTPQWSGNVARFNLVTAPSLDTQPGQTIYYFRGSTSLGTTFSLNPDRDEQMSAAYCNNKHPDHCGTPVNLDPATGTPPTSVVVTFPSGCVWWVAQSSDVTVSNAASGSFDVSVDMGAGEYRVSFSGEYADLPDLTRPYDLCTFP